MTSSTPACGTDRLCSPLIISGQHDNTDAHILQLPDGARAVFLDDIRYRYDSEQLSFSL